MLCERENAYRWAKSGEDSAGSQLRNPEVCHGLGPLGKLLSDRRRSRRGRALSTATGFIPVV